MNARGLLRVTAAAAVTLIGMRASLAVAENVPEFFMDQTPSSFCQLTARLPTESPTLARDRMFKFLELSKEITKGWRSRYVVVGVDFVGLDTFHVILHHSCGDVKNGDHFPFSFFSGWHRSHCEANCGAKPIAIEADPSITFGARDLRGRFTSQIALFLHYRPKADLARCTAMAKLTHPPLAGANGSLVRAIEQAGVEYRLPIVDVSQLGTRVFILFGRGCSQKKLLTLRVFDALARLGANTKDIGSVTFDPDVTDYLYSETGMRQ